MTYIENVFICMLSPLLIAAFCMGKKQLRLFPFCIAGMGACLFSAYINTFFAAIYQTDSLAAAVENAPVKEEVMSEASVVATGSMTTHNRQMSMVIRRSVSTS